MWKEESTRYSTRVNCIDEKKSILLLFCPKEGPLHYVIETRRYIPFLNSNDMNMISIPKIQEYDNSDEWKQRQQQHPTFNSVSRNSILFLLFTAVSSMMNLSPKMTLFNKGTIAFGSIGVEHKGYEIGPFCNVIGISLICVHSWP